MRLAILCCEDAVKWVGWTERLWTERLLKPSGDSLTTYKCFAGEFPGPATCRDEYDAIVVGGSHYSAYDNLPWIRQLEALLPQYLDAGVRVVGCCFGHQILAKALGGRVGKNPSGRFVLGIERVRVDVAAAWECGLALPLPTCMPQPPRAPLIRPPSVSPFEPTHDAAVILEAQAVQGFLQESSEQASTARVVGGNPESLSHGLQLRLLQSHGDQVLALPPGASLLAASDTAPYEMWALGNRCLAFQFHPELTPDLIYDKIWSTLTASGRLSAEEAVAVEAQLKAGPGAVDSDLFLQALQAFLRAPLDPRHGVSSQALETPVTATEDAAAKDDTAAVASTAANEAEAAAKSGVRAAEALRQELECRATEAVESVLGHVRQAATASLAEGTSNAELLTALNQRAAAAYGKAAATAEGAAAQLAASVSSQQLPLQAALASLGALEAQLDRLAVVVGSLERESAAVELQAESQAREATAAREQQQQQGRVQQPAR